jgi:hypothetical protein
MKHVVLLSMVTVALLAGCARDCATLVEQHCKAAPLEAAECKALAERAAKVPAQTCEAVLQALESRGADR